MRHPIVVGNWKMNGSRGSVKALTDALKAGLTPGKPCDVAVCPPYIYIPDVSVQLEGSGIMLGAQNVSDQPEGAFTGEVSPAMLMEFGCKFAIVGHSERRMLQGKTNEMVAARYHQAYIDGMTPILCIGETLVQREDNQTFAVLDAQLGAIIEHSGVESLSKAIIAYEPVWAIGTGLAATKEQAQEAHAYIRGLIATHDPVVAEGVRILYGGSVKPDNAKALFSMPDIDGGLIGGASLDANSFISICKAAG